LVVGETQEPGGRRSNSRGPGLLQGWWELVSNATPLTSHHPSKPPAHAELTQHTAEMALACQTRATQVAKQTRGVSARVSRARVVRAQVRGRACRSRGRVRARGEASCNGAQEPVCQPCVSNTMLVHPWSGRIFNGRAQPPDPGHPAAQCLIPCQHPLPSPTPGRIAPRPAPATGSPAPLPPSGCPTACPGERSNWRASARDSFFVRSGSFPGGGDAAAALH
jgi:hypothetical protein